MERAIRESSASHHASTGLSQAHLENCYRWVSGSDAASRYITVSRRAPTTNWPRCTGLTSTKGKRTASVPECPQCGYEEKREGHFCSRSGQAMRAEAAAEVRDREEDVKRDDAETELGDEQQDEIDSLGKLLADPEVQGALLQLMDVG